MSNKSNKMSKQLIDINLFLPNFYTKSQQIQLKLNPILDNLRSTNIVSYHQITDKTHFTQQLQTLPHSTPLKPKPLPTKQLSTLNQNQCIFDNKNTDLQFAKTTYVSHGTSQTHRKKFFATIDNPSNAQTSQRPRNNSFQIRSKTSDKIKSKKPYSKTPGTADLTNNTQQLVELQKLNLFIKNPESQLDFDDDLCNYIRLKMLTKNPYFSGGKFSKIKKHLVEQINLEEIEKKFFKSTAYNTKYKEFFQRIMWRKKQNQSQIERFNRSTFSTLSPKKLSKVESINEQKDSQGNDKTPTEFNISKFSQTAQRQDSPLGNKGFSRQRSKKLTMKAKLLFRKSPTDLTATPLNSLSDAEDLTSRQNEMGVQGKAPSPTLQKYLQTRKNKFNVHKDLMKRAYRLDCQ